MARILSPRAPDQVTIPPGGVVPVLVWYDYAVVSNLQCYVDGDRDLPTALLGTTIMPRPVNCISKMMAGTFPVPVKVYTNGALDETQTPVRLVVTAPSPTPTYARVNPPPPAMPPAVGTGPIQYIVSDTFAAGVEYIVLVAQELTINPGVPPVPVDGVFIKKAGPTWAGLVTIPNNPNRMYTARIIQFDANDIPVSYQTVVLA